MLKKNQEGNVICLEKIVYLDNKDTQNKGERKWGDGKKNEEFKKREKSSKYMSLCINIC